MSWSKAFEWCRDHLGRVIASTTAFTFLWIAVGIAVVVGYYWDGEWAKDQAPAGMELSFQAGGWVIRTWTVFALVGAVALFRHKAFILGSLVTFSWLCTSVLAYGHVLGFMATGQSERYNAGSAVENRVEISDTGLEDKLTLIATQKAEIRTDRDSDVKALESALDDLINDGDATNDKEATDAYTALIAERRQKATDDLALLSQTERDLVAGNTATKLTANEEQVTTVKFDPLYGWLAGWFANSSYTNDATRDDTLRMVAQRWATIWAAFIELIGGAGPAILYAAHAHFSDRRTKQESENGQASTQNEAANDKNDLTEAQRRALEKAQAASRTQRKGQKIPIGETTVFDGQQQAAE